MITLKEGKIIDQWSTLIEQCQGHGEGLLQVVEANLKAYEAPDVNWKRESVAPGWIKGLFGKRRVYLLLTHERVHDYLMCIRARHYGTNLDVSWYLTGSTKSVLVRALSQVPGVRGCGRHVRRLPIDRCLRPAGPQCLRYSRHHSVLKAVEELMQQ